MCNRYGLNHPLARINAEMSETRIRLRFPAGLPNLEPREEIKPTDTAPIVRNGVDGPELTQLRWGFAPGRPKAGPVINFRSEGRRFGPQTRCLIPASHFFEFTGDKYPKTKWRFTLPDPGLFCLAGLWRPGKDGAPGAFTMLTTEPGPDVTPYHDRQIVVLAREHWAAWLEAAGDVAVPDGPLPAGSLVVEKG